MKAHLTLKCPMVNHNVKLEYLRKISSKDLEQTIQNQSDDNDNNIADTAKINKALDFVKSLCYKYELPEQTTLSGNYLDTKIANITLKVKEELRFLKNLTLG
ncbi:8006_t:CDS:2 [Funneliformis geosporum]|nr:8006_t:CDS:2 [Funneliformis geosporum]